MQRNPTAMLLIVALCAMGVASAEDELTSLSYISYMERYATVQPVQQEQSLEAVINLPLVAGDRLDTAREARVEVMLSDGSLLWLDEYTTLSFDSVALSRDTSSDRTVLYLAEGRIMLELPEPPPGIRATRIDSGSDTVYLSSAGLYRLETVRGGGLQVAVHSGLAELATPGGGVLVRSSYAAQIANGGVNTLDLAGEADDSFSFWVAQRRQLAAGEGSVFVGDGQARNAATLDNYGTWVYLESNNSWAWQPAVSSSWRPYTAGRWYWTPVGWSWVSYEPWGWMPYHYGSWQMHAGYGWLWSWDRYWSPAWVHWMWYPGYVGWSPVGYYGGYWNDYWYGHHGGGGHGGYPGGGSSAPSRRDVVPRRTTSTLTAPGSAQPTPGRTAFDLRGRVRVADMDRTPWNVVAIDDFSSPHMARLVKPGDVALRGRENAEAVVASGALRTRTPTRVNPGEELRSTFASIQRQSTTDLSPLLSRSGSLSSARGTELARPTNVAELSRATIGSGSAGARSASAVRPSVAPRGTTVDRSTRQTAPNLYRPVLGSTSSAGDAAAGSSRRSSGSRTLVLPSSGATGRGSVSPGSTGSERGSVVRPQGSSGSSVQRSTPSSGRPTVVPRSATPAPRTPSASDGGASRSSRVLVPSRSGSASRPVVIPTSSSSSRSNRVTVSPSRSSSSASSSRSRSSASSSSSSRSSTSRSAPARASSSSSSSTSSSSKKR